MNEFCRFISLSVAALLAAASCGGDENENASSNGERQRPAPTAANTTLILLRERSLSELLPAAESGFKDAHYEASGVTLHDGSLQIVFDNSTRVAHVDPTLSHAALSFSSSSSSSQYEGITIATRPSPKTYVVKEAASGERGVIVTIDKDGHPLASEPTDILFRDGNKGLEGIAWLDDLERLLVLCEMSACGDDARSADGAVGDAGADRRRGVIKAMRHDAESYLWRTEATLLLPSIVDFEDYSDLAVMRNAAHNDESPGAGALGAPGAPGNYLITVVSQRSAALWLGDLTTQPLLSLSGSSGVVYGFPESSPTKPGGKTHHYCSIEGVTFLDRTTFALVSDRAKENESSCNKGEAVHVFALPRPSAR